MSEKAKEFIKKKYPNRYDLAPAGWTTEKVAEIMEEYKNQSPSPQDERIMQLEMTLLISRQAMMNALAAFGTMVQTNKYDEIAIGNLKEAIETINRDMKT